MKMNIQYIVGFFDSGGNVYCGVSTKAYKNHRYWWPQVKILIRHNNQEILKKIHNYLKLGTVQLIATSPSKKYRFAICIIKPNQIINFVKDAISHSIAKKDELELAKQAALFILGHSPRYSKEKTWLKEDIQAYKEQFIDKSKAMKGTSSRGRPRTYRHNYTTRTYRHNCTKDSADNRAKRNVK